MSTTKNIYDREEGVQTRWSTFENPAGGKGVGGTINAGGKGNAFEDLKPGECKVLCNVQGSGVITRFWMTIRDRSPFALRQIRVRMYWEDCCDPAVDVPLGDFFCAPLGRLVPFENQFFSSPEAHSFNCVIPMPFLKGARIELVNDGETRITHVFYEINYELRTHATPPLYFHSIWRRENPVCIGSDYTILPKISGCGKVIGMNAGITLNPIYNGSWWGEGEVKVYLDGDGQWPTLCGTGTEDYIGTGWGQKTFINMNQGCLIAEKDKHFTFYRLHIPDPIHFSRDIKMDIQIMGGANGKTLVGILERGAKCSIVSGDLSSSGVMELYLDPGQSVPDSFRDDTWYNFYREDDFSSTVYFYLDSPAPPVPHINDFKIRTDGIASAEK